MTEWLRDDDELTDTDLAFLEALENEEPLDLSDAEVDTSHLQDVQRQPGDIPPIDVEAIDAEPSDDAGEMDVSETDMPDPFSDVPFEDEDDTPEDEDFDSSDPTTHDEYEDDDADEEVYDDDEAEQEIVSAEPVEAEMDADDEDHDEPQSEADHLEDGESDEILDGEDDLEYQDAKVEDEFEGEDRANTEEEIEDLDDYERQREEAEAKAEEKPESKDDLPREDQNQNPDADGDGEREQEPTEEIQDDASEDEDEDNTAAEAYMNLPEAGPRCTNHCEDNEAEEDPEECPHCKERIRIEREQWGAVALDMDNQPLLPGDHVRVAIPHPMSRKDSVLAVNVPNLEIDEPRFAESTGGEVRHDLCWLSGHGISRFTGWHMVGSGNPIFKFEKGKKIDFVQKLASPEFEDIDPEQMVEELLKELEDHGKENQPKDEPPADPEPEEPQEPQDEPTEAESEAEPEAEEQDDEPQADETEDEVEERRRHRSSEELTKQQHQRFDNIVSRIDPKIESTFGNTLESHAVGEARHNHVSAEQTIIIVSRGVEYTIKVEAKRHHESENEDAA